MTNIELIEQQTRQLADLTQQLRRDNHALAARIAKLDREIEAAQHHAVESPWPQAASAICLAFLNQLPESRSMEDALTLWRVASDALLMIGNEMGRESLMLKDTLESAYLSGASQETISCLQRRAAENTGARIGLEQAQQQLLAILEARGVVHGHGHA